MTGVLGMQSNEAYFGIVGGDLMQCHVRGWPVPRVGWIYVRSDIAIGYGDEQSRSDEHSKRIYRIGSGHH